MNRARPRRIKPTDKRAILLTKQGGKCAHCNKVLQIKNPRSMSNYGTYDHILPKSLGGTNNIENLQLLCFECNQKKAAKTNNVETRLDGRNLWISRERN